MPEYDTDTVQEVRLLPHPDAAGGPIETVTVLMERRGDRMWLRFVAEGEANRVEWPKQAEPGRADNLWEHTCFEAFVGTGDGYVEFNLSPSGRWASYVFDGYRSGMKPSNAQARVDGMDAAWDMVALEAEIDFPGDAETLGLAAVIEAADGSKTYWALKHPADSPDFHHPASFTLPVWEPA